MDCLFAFFLIFLQQFSGEALNFSGKSYYFKTNGNNEFTVYNRIHFLNHNISDFDANPHPPQNIRGVKKTSNNLVNREPQKNINLTKYYLDEEWNYEHKPINKSNLPFFIKKFYEQRLKEPNKTNTVRIFFNTNRNSTSRIIKFNLGSLKSNENVSDADMYFYWPLKNSSSIFKTSVVLRLYQFENQYNNDLNESNLMENPDIHKLFNVIYISKAQKGWQTFKIKKPINNWANGEPNLGLLLTISSYDENKLISIFNDTNEGIFRTFAVLNINKNETTNPSAFNNTLPDQHNSTVTTNPKSTLLTPMCSKRTWHLDFKHLHWTDFILYPETGIMAYQCSGKCHLDEDTHHLNNHVKLRHIANGIHGIHKEKVCCVPTEYRSLPLMFLDRFENVVLKNYDELVVHNCGCR